MTITLPSRPVLPTRRYWFPPSNENPATTICTSLRTRSLEQTEALARTCLARCGITRIADVTDLDVVGIPVFHSARPGAAPGLNTVTSGKGVTAEAARVSAMMEAIERTWCEPQSQGLRLASYEELRRAHAQVLDPRRLIVRCGHTWNHDAPVTWFPVRELRTGTEVLVPALAVFTPFGAEHGMFRSNTIGLAIGNSPQEALLHGLFEVIEHDCTAFGETLRQGSRIRLASLPEGPAELAERFQRAGVDVQLFAYTNEIGVHTMFATTEDTGARDGMLINGGAGCHLDPVVAATRALCEAAQSRLSVIAGAREDLGRQAYRRLESYEAVKEMFQAWSTGRAEADFDDFPAESTGTTAGDLAQVLAGLEQARLPLVLAVELAPANLPFSVTKVIVPGLEVRHQDKARLGTRLYREMVRAGMARALW